MADPRGWMDYPRKTHILYPFACFTCRKSFKRRIPIGNAPEYQRCPQCAGQAVRLSRNFKPPAARDTTQWQKVKMLVDAGFRFEHVEGQNGYEPYPETLKDVADFVRRYPRQPRKP